MSYIVADRVKESSTIVGTGTISLLGSNTGFRTFASQMSVGDTCSYVIANTTGSEWEVGIATYSSANTLTRTTVQSSTNANAVVNFSAGMKDVFISPTAQSVIDYNPITHQISNANSIVASPVASGVGNSLTITAGSGIGTGAGGSLILQAGLQASSGGDGKVIVKKVSGQTSNLQEWQNSDGTVVASIGNDGSIWTSGTNTVPLKPINYTYTGTLDVPPIIILSMPTPAQIGSTVGDYSGKWVAVFILSSANLALTSISFTDLQGTLGNIYLSLPNLTSLSFPALTTIGGTFNPSSMASLTSLSMPALTTVGGTFNPSSMASLTSLNLPALTTVGSIFNPTNMASLTSLNLPALTTVAGNFNPGTMASLTSLSIPTLTTVGNSFNPAGMPALTSLSAPALTTIGGTFQPGIMNAITLFSLPALTTVGGTFGPSSMSALSSISIPSIIRIGITVTSGSAISIVSGTAVLTTFQLPSTLLQVGNGGGNVVITSAALNQASVDSILVRLAALDGTNGTTLFSTRTVTITGTSSTPSATGLAAKATLVARGCTVTTN